MSLVWCTSPSLEEAVQLLDKLGGHLGRNEVIYAEADRYENGLELLIS
jgi:hypothetical protein